MTINLRAFLSFFFFYYDSMNIMLLERENGEEEVAQARKWGHKQPGIPLPQGKSHYSCYRCKYWLFPSYHRQNFISLREAELYCMLDSNAWWVRCVLKGDTTHETEIHQLRYFHCRVMKLMLILTVLLISSTVSICTCNLIHTLTDYWSIFDIYNVKKCFYILYYFSLHEQ